jgi:hypothetical protein
MPERNIAFSRSILHQIIRPKKADTSEGTTILPVAVAVILIYDSDKIPRDIEMLVRTGVEAGAALFGTIQTENIGVEQMAYNIIGNQNIRHLVLTGPESPGHPTGEAIKSLLKDGVAERKRCCLPILYTLGIFYLRYIRQDMGWGRVPPLVF